ncbi:hypothetical protein N9413_12210 [Paracoccaceae bacterium]|nr:hypothetical protein [Paracoccaceae bacterium]
MLPVRSRDARLALSCFRASGKSAVQPTAGLAGERRFLARGAAAGSCAAALEGACGAYKRPDDTL